MKELRALLMLQKAEYHYFSHSWPGEREMATLLPWRKLVVKINHQNDNKAILQPLGQISTKTESKATLMIFGQGNELWSLL